MIVQRLFSRKTKKDKYHPVLHDLNYDVNVKEDNQEFDKHLEQRVKGDKITRRIAQVGLPATIGAIAGVSSKGGMNTKGAITGAAIGSAIGYGTGKTIDKITKFNEKQKNAKSKVSEEYKKLGFRGYKGQYEREKYRRKYLDSSKNLKDIK